MNTIFKTFLAIFMLLVFGSCISGEKYRETAKLNQYMVQGMQLYRIHCVNCHQVDGTGLARLYPPLKNSDYLQKMDPGDLACQIRNGVEGEMEVNGIVFNQPMPPIPQLTPLEIAEIITYVNNNWGEQKGLYDVKAAESALKNCDL